jgi:hypothetical protein
MYVIAIVIDALVLIITLSVIVSVHSLVSWINRDVNILLFVMVDIHTIFMVHNLLKTSSSPK